MSKIIHTVTVPAAMVEHLQESTDTEVVAILVAGKSAGRGAVRVSATRDDLEAVRDACWAFDGTEGVEASKRERAAFLRYAKALSELPRDPAPAGVCVKPVVSSATGEATGKTCGGALGDVAGTLVCGRCGMFSDQPDGVPGVTVSEPSAVEVWENEGGFCPDVYGDRRAYSQPEAETVDQGAWERATRAAGVVRDAGMEASELASELGRVADQAEGLASGAEEWSGEADGALSVAEAERAWGQADSLAQVVGRASVGKRESERTGEDVRPASGLVKDAASMLRKILGLRKTMENASSACSGDAEMEGVCDHWHGVVVNAEADAREALGRVEEASGRVVDAVESIEGVIAYVCGKCGCLVTPGTDGGGKLTRDMGSCGCRAVMAARLDALGGFQPDVEAVRAGRLLDADHGDLVEAGQLALAGCWDEAADKIADAARYDSTGEAAVHVQAPAPVVVLPGAVTAAVAERAAVASIERERAETAAALEGYHAAGDAVRASFDARWAVQAKPVEGVPVRVTRGGKGPVDVAWSGVGRQCWSHCPDSCPGMEIAEWCTCEPYPVVLVDGPGEPYGWEDCARCAGSTLGVAESVMVDAAVRSATGERDVVDLVRVEADMLSLADGEDASAVEHETLAAALREDADRQDVADMSGFTDAWRARMAQAPGRWRQDADEYMALAAGLRAGASVMRSWAESGVAVPAVPVSAVAAVPLVALPDVMSDPSGIDVWESEGGAVEAALVICHGKRGGVFPVAFRGPYAGTVRVSRSVALVEARRRLEAARDRLVVAREYSETCTAWCRDASDLHKEARRSAGVLGESVWVDSETSGNWYYHARGVETASFQRRYHAEIAVRACERNVAAIEAEAVEVAERGRAGRRFLDRAVAGEVPAGRGAWVSVDGGTAVMFPLSVADDAPGTGLGSEGRVQDAAFVDLLGDAVAARDEGRVLTSKDFPTAGTHGKRSAASAEHKRAVVRSGQPLFKAWAAPKIPKAGKAPDAKTVQEWDEAWAHEGGILAETETAPGVWLPMAAVQLADMAMGNGWAVTMERHDDGRIVVVRVAGTLPGGTLERSGEIVAVWIGGEYMPARSQYWVRGERQERLVVLRLVFGTVSQVADAPDIRTSGVPDAPEDRATVKVADTVSEPGTVEGWDGEGGALEPSLYRGRDMRARAYAAGDRDYVEACRALVEVREMEAANPRDALVAGWAVWAEQLALSCAYRVKDGDRDGAERLARSARQHADGARAHCNGELSPPAESDDRPIPVSGQDSVPSEAAPVMVGGVCSCGAGIERPLNGPRPACTHEGAVGRDGSTVVGGRRVKASGVGRCMNDRHDVDGVSLYVAGNHVPQCGPCVADRIGVDVSALPAPEPEPVAVPELVAVAQSVRDVHEGSGIEWSWEASCDGDTGYRIGGDCQGRAGRSKTFRVHWVGEDAERFYVHTLGVADSMDAAHALIRAHSLAAKTIGDPLAAGDAMDYASGQWHLPPVGVGETITYGPDRAWTITRADGEMYRVTTVRGHLKADGTHHDPLIVWDTQGREVGRTDARYEKQWPQMLGIVRDASAAGTAPVVYGSARWLAGRLDTLTDTAPVAVWDSGVCPELDVYADHRAVVMCRNAEWQAAQAHALYQDAEAERVLFEARELTGACAAALDADEQAEAEDRARRARGLVAVMILCALDDNEGWTYSPESFEALPEGARTLLTEYASPLPVRWLFPRPTPQSERLLIPFHGPGGWAYGIRHVLRAADVDMVGIDNEPGAVETARAAGFECVLGSVTDIDPDHVALRYVTGKVPSPPCTGFTIAGLGAGRAEDAVETIAGAIRAVPQILGWDPDGSTTPQGVAWDELREDLEGLPDPRPGLMLEVAVWAGAMRAEGGDLRWIAMEQSHMLPAPILGALRETLTLLGFRTIETETLDATVHGAASHRKRLFLLAFLGEQSPAVSMYPERPMPVTSFAKLTGWNETATVNTRGKRGINPKTGKPKGGGSFSASKVSTCITATAYGWTNSETGERFNPADIGRAVGFPGGFPWQHVGRGEGIRNKTQRKADVVFTGTAAAVIGRAIGRLWEPQTREYIETLYDHAPEPETVTAEIVEPLAIEGSTAPRRLAIEGAPVRLALDAAPVPTGRAFWEPGERVTLAGRAGRTTHSRIGGMVRVVWDDAPVHQGTDVQAERLWMEGTEPSTSKPIVPPYRPAPRMITLPYTAPLADPVPEPVRAVIPAPRTQPVPVTVAAVRSVPVGTDVDPLMAAFGDLERELDAARAQWDRIAI